MPMTAETSVLGRALDWIKAHVFQDDEFAMMSATDMQLLAADIGVSAADLRAIGPALTNHDALMEKMLRARGLDPDKVRLAFGALAREMEVTCSRCREAGVCQRELAAGTATEHAHEFCGNAAAMDELLRARV